MKFKKEFIFLYFVPLILLSFQTTQSIADSDWSEKVFVWNDFEHRIMSIDFTENSKRIAVGTQQGRFLVLNHEKENLVINIGFFKFNKKREIPSLTADTIAQFKRIGFDLYKSRVNKVSASPKENKVAVAYNNSSSDKSKIKNSRVDNVFVYNLENQQPESKFEVSVFPENIVFSPEGVFLAGVGQKKIKIWNTKSKKELRDFQNSLSKNNTANDVEYSQRGKYLAVGYSSGQIGLWKPRAGKKIKTIQAHEGQEVDDPLKTDTDPAIVGLAFRQDAKPKERELVSFSEDMTIKVWEYPSLELKQTIRLPSDVGHPNTKAIPSGAALSPSGDVLFVTFGATIVPWSFEEKVFLSRLQTGKETMTGENSIQAIDVSPNGKYIAVGTGHGPPKQTEYQIKVWENPFYESNSAERTSQPGKAPPGKGRKK